MTTNAYYYVGSEVYIQRRTDQR